MRVFSKLARKLMHPGFRDRLLAAPDEEALVGALDLELGITADRIG
jgi:mannitol/fructose-specific phosphotransferase system IIA component (Ntr-type)